MKLRLQAKLDYLQFEYLHLDTGNKLFVTNCLTGSFKVRGIVNQFANIPSEIINSKKKLVSMSAGNYGKAFAFATKKQNLPATLCMPDSAPVCRAKLIEVRKKNYTWNSLTLF